MSEPHYNERTVLHWYDFACPFSYVGQHRTALLVELSRQLDREARTPAAQTMVSASSRPCSSSTPCESQEITRVDVMTSTPFLARVRRI